ncbi:MAG: exo-alpha-sialidase [Euryarchaeota archaeon]|nr:exo-alpha-sialidase [Euryarchaeota archaeon]
MRAAVSLATVLIFTAASGCVTQGPGGVDANSLSGLIPDDLAGVASGLTMRLPAIVDPERWSGEPSILVTKHGTILITGAGGATRYATNPADAATDAGQSYIWRSSDGGKTWDFVDLLDIIRARNAGPGVESDLAADFAGTIYFPDMSGASVSLGTSSDDGKTWPFVNPIASTLPGIDRPWAAASRNGFVHVSFLQLAAGHYVSSSANSGYTFDAPVKLEGCGGVGNIAADPEAGTVYLACLSGADVKLFRSQDGGKTFELTTIHRDRGNFTTIIGPWVDADSDGMVAITWTEARPEGGSSVYYTFSRDSGKSWTEPRRVDTLDGTAMMATVAIHHDRRAVVAWYGAGEAGSPDSLDVDWYVVMAAIENPGTPAETMTVGDAVGKPIKHGPICGSGLGCVTDNRAKDRNLLDFFEVDLDGQGKAHIAYTDASGAVPLIGYVGEA